MPLTATADTPVGTVGAVVSAGVPLHYSVPESSNESAVLVYLKAAPWVLAPG